MFHKVKVWFQNRRMKHKRQTLSKEDGDDKDGALSDGVEKTKSDKIMVLDDDEKKSCHNCDISGVGDVGSTLSGDVSELSGSRSGATNNNNNTPSVTNNNTGFNTNSNGASSVGSTNSVSSCFEKIMADDDSRSQDGSEVTSPSVNCKKLSSEIRIKVETEHKSPSSSKQQILLGKKSPATNTKDICTVNSNGVLLAMPDSTVGTPGLPGQGSSTRSLTPSSTPGTPASVHLQQGSPLSMQNAHGYMQRPRSSPSSTSTGQNPILPHNTSNSSTIAPHSNRSVSGNPQSHFQQQSMYQTSNIDYRNGIPANRHPIPGVTQQATQQNAYCPREAYQQRSSYQNDIHPLYTRQNQSRMSHHARQSGAPSRAIYNSSMQFHQQQQAQYGNVNDYNGYSQGNAYNNSYHRNVHSTNSYTSNQSYSNTQSETHDNFMNTGYCYSGAGYHNDNISAHGHSQSGQHYYGDMATQHQQHHHSENFVHHQTDYRAGNKCHANAYYEQTSQMHVHQGGEASNIPTNYVSSPDPFPATGITTTATAIAAATAAVITPPGVSGQNDNIDSYNNYNHFYNESALNVNSAPPASADNSNSSSDFNFLSNLANDFAPEYYQLS